MDLKENDVAGITVLEVKGRLDSASSPALGERLTAILEAAKARVLVDFSQLEEHQQRRIPGAPHRGEAR